ncbi:uncharacterized protein BO95DRAFT_73790 [Aspergillus brunneoviolaceus CBS 621.78]|uniref:Uncharacterized protein n=1 Tax=Aspergillus brunneoviolaceus CBS 621.78 TaxID=1450534 RepID=A0ACD1GF81_9EURO|nr:hypothetical protein BO95DRAFT_73790 [Aspergillus brunneoviolaceus CBS 621.78]RAH47746.1 hypothetical protein BO95DRAFT_73790 [Aspergillus brunneoviolaceus CBS 621.78]
MSDMKREPSSPGLKPAQSQVRETDVDRTGNISGLRYLTCRGGDPEPRAGIIGGILQLEGKWFGLTVLSPFLEDHFCGVGTQPFWHTTPYDAEIKSTEIYGAREPHALWGRIPPDPETLQPQKRYFSRIGNWALMELVNQELAETCVPGPDASWVLLPTIMDKDKPVPRWQLMIPDRELPPSDEPLDIVKPCAQCQGTADLCYHYAFKSDGFLSEWGAWVIEEPHLSVVGIVHFSDRFTIQAIPAWWTFNELKQRFPALKPPLICCAFPNDNDFLGSGYDTDNDLVTKDTDDIPAKKEELPSV